MTRELAIAEGKYIKKEDALKAVQKNTPIYINHKATIICHDIYYDISELPTYSFPERGELSDADRYCGGY